MDNQQIKADVKNIPIVCNLSYLSNKTILITGASGLVGTYLLYTICECGNYNFIPKKVFAIVHSGIPVHLEKLTENKFIEFIKGDLTDDSFISNLPEADIIIHSGGYAQPQKFLQKQIESLEINSSTILKLIKKLSVGGHFLFISSSTVYTNANKKILKENDIGNINTDHPRICYIEGKRFGESLCNIYRKSGVDAKIIRLAFTYGPGVKRDDQRVIYEFISKALSGNICLLDEGKAIHTYCYISDAIQLIWNILLYGTQNCYNVSGIESASIFEIASIIGKKLGVNVILGKNSGVPGADDNEVISIERYTNEFGKKEFISLGDGLTRTINWYKQYYE